MSLRIWVANRHLVYSLFFFRRSHGQSTLYFRKSCCVEFTSSQLLFMMYGISALVLFPFVSPNALLKLGGFQIFLLSFCCLNTVVAYGCFTEALNCWDASKVSAVLALAPLFTIMDSNLLFLSSQTTLLRQIRHTFIDRRCATCFGICINGVDANLFSIS